MGDAMLIVRIMTLCCLSLAPAGARAADRHVTPRLADLHRDDAPGGGVRIVLTVPGRTAYVGQGPAWQALARWWQSRRRP
jgi:hypothetical protein